MTCPNRQAYYATHVHIVARAHYTPPPPTSIGSLSIPREGNPSTQPKPFGSGPPSRRSRLVGLPSPSSHTYAGLRSEVRIPTVRQMRGTFSITRQSFAGSNLVRFENGLLEKRLGDIVSCFFGLQLLLFISILFCLFVSKKCCTKSNKLFSLSRPISLLTWADSDSFTTKQHDHKLAKGFAWKCPFQALINYLNDNLI